MVTSEDDLVESIRETPINYGLLKLIHHELGNGLTVLSGYRQLLQNAISVPPQEALPSTQDGWQARDERVSGYLRTMQDRETRLHDLLLQLRELSPGTTDEPLCQNFVRTDLVVLFGKIIAQRVPLCPDCALQTNMPAQPLFILCDAFWIQVLFEHLLNYIIGYTDTMPTEIHLERVGREAKTTLRFGMALPEFPPGEETFGALVREFEVGEIEACRVLCHEILQEHGGRIWSEQAGSISLALPLAE